MSFIQFNIVEFYPSITYELLVNAISFAKNHILISDDECEIIIAAKNLLLYCEGNPWKKKGTDSLFDVTMGSFDGAKTCEFIGLYILSKLKDLDTNLGLYRDDGLGATCKTRDKLIY